MTHTQISGNDRCINTLHGNTTHVMCVQRIKHTMRLYRFIRTGLLGILIRIPALGLRELHTVFPRDREESDVCRKDQRAKRWRVHDQKSFCLTYDRNQLKKRSWSWSNYNIVFITLLEVNLLRSMPAVDAYAESTTVATSIDIDRELNIYMWIDSRSYVYACTNSKIKLNPLSLDLF